MKNPFLDKRPPSELTQGELGRRLMARLRWAVEFPDYQMTCLECQEFIDDVQLWNGEFVENTGRD